MAKGIKLTRRTGTAAEEAELSAQEQREAAIAEAVEREENNKASDALNDKLNAELEAKQADIRDLDQRKADAIRADEIRKEADIANAAMRDAANKSKASEVDTNIREQREQMNMNPTMFKDPSMRAEFIQSVLANSDGRTLDATERKAFNDAARGILSDIDAKTVELRTGNLAMERPEGSSQVVTNDAVQLLHTGDKLSNSSLIAQLQARSSRLNEAHEARVDDLQNSVDNYREKGDDKKADFYELKIAQEKAAHERDAALNVLSQYEYMDADRGETARIVDQKADVERLRDQADMLYAEVQKAEEFQRIQDTARELDVAEEAAFEKETQELDASMENDFADIEAIQEEAEHQRQLELEEYSAQETEEDDPYLAEERAFEELERRTEAINSGKEEFSDEEWQEDSDEQALRNWEENNDADSDSEDTVAELDEDLRTHEDIENETQEDDAQTEKYDMKSGKIVLEHEDHEQRLKLDEDEKFNEVERTEQHNDFVAYEYPDMPQEADISEEPEFDDDGLTDVDIENFDNDSSFLQKPVDNLEDHQTVDQVEADPVEAEIEDTISEIETPDVEDGATAKVAKASVDNETISEQSPREEQASVASQATVQNEKVEADSDVKNDIPESYLSKMNDLERELETAKAEGDFIKQTELESSQLATCTEFNQYMDDRESFDSKMSTLRSSASDFAAAKNPAERERAKETYVDTLNSAANDIQKSGDKPWANTMATQLNGEYKDQIETLKKGNTADARELDQAVKESRNPDLSKTVRVTREDVQMARQMRESQGQSQTDKTKDIQSESSTA